MWTDKAIDVVIDKVGPLAANAYPALKPVVMVAQVCKPYIKATTRTAVNAGVQKLGTYAKSVAKIAVSEFRTGVSKVKSTLKSWLGIKR